VGEEPNHTTAKKPRPLQIIQYSLVKSVPPLLQSPLLPARVPPRDYAFPVLVGR
jgi:hypothetical protein